MLDGHHPEIEKITNAVEQSDGRDGHTGVARNVEIPRSCRPAAAYCGLLVIGASVEDITHGGDSAANSDDETQLSV